MRQLNNKEFCSSSRRNLVKLRSLLKVNDEILLNFNEEIGQQYHCTVVSL